ncbi:MAG: Crp/Fnr family transcriptional regulator [Xenococcaceae cyanobacterium]
MQIKDLCGILKQTSIGETLSEEEVSRLAQAGTVREVEEETVLLAEGAQSDLFLVLLKGEVEILKGEQESKQHRLRICDQGSVLGEIGLLMNVPRTATVRTISPCWIFEFKREAFDKLLTSGDSAGSKLSVQLARVLGHKLQMLTNEVVHLLDEHDDLQKAIDSLRASWSQNDVEKMRSTFLKRADQLRESNLRLKKQLYYLNTEIKQTKIARRGAELIMVLSTGVIATLIMTQFLGALKALLPSSSPSPSLSPHPAAIPYITNEEECKKRAGSIWRDGECLDFEQDPTF